MSLNGKVPFEILPERRHNTWVLAVLLFTQEFHLEPLVPYVICYDTSPEEVLDQIGQCIIGMGLVSCKMSLGAKTHVMWRFSGRISNGTVPQAELRLKSDLYTKYLILVRTLFSYWST